MQTGRIYKTSLAAFCITFFMLALGRADGEGSLPSSEADASDNCAIWGQVVVPGHSVQEPVFIEIVGKDGVPSQKVEVINGNYRFKLMPPESYQFRVSDQSGRVIHKEVRTIRGANNYIVIATTQRVAGSSRGGLVSLTELKHKTPRKARDEFNAGGKAAENGDTRKSVEHWLSALKIDPQFSEARINLAVQYGKMGLHSEALEHGRMAYETNPGNQDVGYRYAMILLANKNYRECETIARAVLKNQWYTAQMKTALAVSLIGQKRNFAEAFDYLQQAAVDFPFARLFAAETLAEIGWRASAIKQVGIYLDAAANPCERARLESVIAGYSRLGASDQAIEGVTQVRLER
jgi:tetratricopeptide (TPR) repeat protein